MEGLILLGILGSGYLLNKDAEESQSTHLELQPPLNQGSHHSIYDLHNFKDSKQYEEQLVRQKYQEAMKGDSKVIDSLNMEGRNTLRNTVPNDENLFDSLSGSKISREEFLKNDQGVAVEPFISGSGSNQINFDENNQLQRHQGYNRRDPTESKTELGRFFPLEKTYGNVFGNSSAGEYVNKARFDSGMYRKNELPFEQEKVPHIDEKSEINHDVGLLYAQRNTVDNQRTLSNPKLSYGGKVLSGKGFDKRGSHGEVFKHLPNQDYENTADKWLVTSGAITGEAIRPEQIVKPTNRSFFNEGKLGPAAPAVAKAVEERPMYKKTTNQQLTTDTVRNASMVDTQVDDDHNKDSFFAYPNEREITSERTHEGHFKSVINAETIGIQDSMKPTIKETTHLENRNGYVGTSVNQSHTTGLQDNLRPALKDTTQFDYTGNAISSIGGSMSNDQYLRADLNPNKEIISQRRDPTPENTKLTSGMDIMNVDIKKIETDYFNPRINNPDKQYQDTPSDYNCFGEKEKDTLDNDHIFSNRIDPENLDPFRKNPYTQSLASFAY
jgi:hypothetical protein